MSRTRLAMLAAALAATAGPVVAQTSGLQLAYAWADAAGNSLSATTVGVGSSVDVRLYLTVTADPNGVVTAGGGFGSAAVRATSAAGLSVTAGSSDAGSGRWDFGSTGDLNLPVDIVLNVGMLFAGGRTPAAGRVLLGTITLRGDTAGDYTVSAADPNPQAGDITLFNTGQSLDGFLSATPPALSVGVQPVPEPVGLLAAAAVLVGGWLSGRRGAARRAGRRAGRTPAPGTPRPRRPR